MYRPKVPNVNLSDITFSFSVALQNMTGSGIQVVYCEDAAVLSSSGTRPDYTDDEHTGTDEGLFCTSRPRF